MNNFNSTNKSLEFFKQTPIDDWSFMGYTTYSENNNDRLARKSAMRSRYKACLNDLTLMKDLTEKAKQKAWNLFAESETEGSNTEGSNPPPSQTIFNNYGTVGAQGVISGGTFNVQSRKRAAANTSEGRTKKKGHLGDGANEMIDERGDDEDNTASISDDIRSVLTKLDDNLSSMHIIDLSDAGTVSVLRQTLDQDNYNEIKNSCAIKAVTLTEECQSLLERISNCPPSLFLFRKQLMNFDEFPENSHFDPYLHNDYDFIHGIVFHFLKLCESPINPISQTLRERTAATWSTLPIINYLFLQFQDVIELKWIEVLHDDFKNSKIDGLALDRKTRSVVLMIELAGGSHTSTTKKLDSDTLKTYKNAIETIKIDNKNKIFTVLYHENTLFFESLTMHNQYYIRERHLKLSVPENPRDLKSFAALLPSLLSWRQAVIDLSQ